MRSPRTGTFALLFLVFLGGCRSRPAAPYPTWATVPPAYVPAQGGREAFDVYALAARDVEAKAGANLDRVSFYPRQRAEARTAASDGIRQVRRAVRMPMRFAFVPRRPFRPAPHQRGWRLIGRTFRWEIEEALRAGRYDAAIDLAIDATRFGFDLTGGGATDASLGFAIVEEARLALLPGLAQFGAGQLGRLAEGLRGALERKAPMERVIQNEHAHTMLAIQSVQDALQKNDFRDLEANLGPGVKEATDYLRNLRDEGAERTTYFQGFVDEAESVRDWLVRSAAKPTAERSRVPKPKLASHRPWRRFAKHFVGVAEPLLEVDDRAVARTRLLALESDLLRRRKLKQPPLRDLRRFNPVLTRDPFSGRTFLYRADRAQYSLYSVGANGRDDGGDTDESFTTPDLTLERRGP